MTLADSPRSGEQNYPHRVRSQTDLDIDRLVRRIPMLTSDDQYRLVDASRWRTGFGRLQPLADAVLAASVAGDDDSLEDRLDKLSDAMVVAWDAVPTLAGSGGLRLVRDADDAEVEEWQRIGDDDSSRPVLSLSDGEPRWYVPSGGRLLVVEVAT